MYSLSLASDSRVAWNRIRWWGYGTKEEVLHGNRHGSKLDGRAIKFGPAPRETIEIDLFNMKPVIFQCLANH